jgi:starvation-inducible outer membrane lipoprotein
MIRVLILTAAFGLSACTEVQNAADRTGRQAATSAVTEVIAINFPQVPKPLIEAFTGCVIDNAQAVEVRELAKDSIVGIDEETITVVRSILARPETQTCLRGRATLTL